MGSTQILSTRNPVCKERQTICQLEKLYEREFHIYASSNGDIINMHTRNAFYETVKLAYSQHMPLTLAPDDVWLTIAKGVSLHINYNAEKLRYM